MEGIGGSDGGPGMGNDGEESSKEGREVGLTKNPHSLQKCHLIQWIGGQIISIQDMRLFDNYRNYKLITNLKIFLLLCHIKGCLCRYGLVKSSKVNRQFARIQTER